MRNRNGNLDGLDRASRKARDAARRNLKPLPNGKPALKVAHQVEDFSAAELLTEELPEAQYAVPGILPEGLTLLAGKSKIGKSWMVLLFALAVASGGTVLNTAQATPGPVLYLALEDNRRRLQGRLKRLLAAIGGTVPDTFRYAVDWPRSDKGGLDAIDSWLKEHERPRLVIIDTWPKFSPAKKAGDAYQQDYDHFAPVKALADRHGVCILLVMHCRKMSADDPLDSVMGTSGAPGCADATLILKRERGQHDAALFITGRDIEEQELALRWDGQLCMWSALGQADEYRMSRERSQLIEVLKQAAEPMTPSEVARRMGKSANAVKQLLWKMSAEGWVQSDAAGRYRIPAA